MKNTKFINLFSPLRVNGVMLSNRIIAAPMDTPRLNLLSSTNYAGVSVLERSTGGAAGICLNALSVAEVSNSKDPFEKYSRDNTREIISVTRQAGAKSILELFFHSMTPREDGTYMMPCDGLDFRNRTARAMSKDEIDDLISYTAEQAKKAKQFGFDMVMLHFGHDSLTSLFLSPVWNHRTDEYGGSLENRMRITIEAAEAVRKAVGPDYPLLARLSRQLMVKETFSENDMLELIKHIENYIDMVNISAGMDEYGGSVDKYEANMYAMPTSFEPHMLNIDFAARVKKETNILVGVVGSVTTPDEAEMILSEGKADCVFMGRALVADPDLPRKALENREEDIVPCIRCMHCYHISTERRNSVCAVNPRFRRENRFPKKIEKAENPMRVVVVGGGPAGCMAALTADQRGHEVILLEKGDSLGGQLNYSDADSYKTDLRRYRDYLRLQIQKSHVDVRLNTIATKESVTVLNPDALIIAMGAVPVSSTYKGSEYTTDALEVFSHIEEYHGKCTIVGSGTIGCELGMELSERGCEVTLIARTDQIARSGNQLYRISLLHHLKSCKNLKVLFNTKVLQIDKTGVTIERGGVQEHLDSDHSIISIGMRPLKEEAFELYGITPRTYMIGDCNAIGKVNEATNEGYAIALNL